MKKLTWSITRRQVRPKSSSRRLGLLETMREHRGVDGKTIQEVKHAHGWSVIPIGLVGDNRPHGRRALFVKVEQKLIRGQGSDAVWRKRRIRKVAEIRGDNP